MVDQGGFFDEVDKVPARIRDRLRSGTAARLQSAMQIYGWRHRDRLGTDVLAEFYTGYSFRKNHPLGPELSASLRALVESGVARHIRHRCRIWTEVLIYTYVASFSMSLNQRQKFSNQFSIHPS